MPESMPSPGSCELVHETGSLAAISVRRSRRQPDAPWLGQCLAARGLVLPDRVGDVSGTADFACSRIEPGAWLLTSRAHPALDTAAPAEWLATDLSDQLAAFRLRGAGAGDVLRAGCNIDAAADRRCLRTLFAESAIVLVQRWHTDDYRVLIDASLEHFLADWLADAARAYSGSAEPLADR